MKAEQQRLPRFAVLIDADNTSPQIAGGLFEEVAKFGEASVRRIYGSRLREGNWPHYDNTRRLIHARE